ncbi:MAG TPA: PrgI family protein [Candidatus Saccharibacteria bacterium]|nr:PrgI family protein [Candidatus Saccharibacteria bacterium]
MAVYKVPQDVEAEDKLIGPFGFRQFIYLIIVALAGVLAWGLAQVFILLAIIPLPIMIFFGVLALPLRKDQPMEIYMAAIVSFYLKPRKRFWDPEGVESLIEVAAPKTEEQTRQALSSEDAEERISYLANIVDSRGWAIHSMGPQTPNTSLNTETYYETREVEDILDNNTFRMQELTQRMDETADRMRQEAIANMQEHAASAAVTPPPPPPEPATPNPFLNMEEKPSTTNPYPHGINQAYVAPLTTSGTPPAAGIMNLVNNADGLSVATVSKEANRLAIKDSPDEVSISLR